MRRLRLYGNTTTTQLGYGCASLMSRLSRDESLRLLDAAYDAGIRHFDVARSYGYGQAEEVVGDLLRRYDDITVTTKCGIAPPARGLAVRLKPLIRASIGAFPPLRPLVRRRAERMITHGAFDPVQTEASLHGSLGALATDRVDVLLLHEATSTDLTEDLLAWLEAQVARGRIGAYGTATNATETAVAISTPFAGVVQVPHTVCRPRAPVRGGLGDRGLVVHSVLADLAYARNALDADRDLRADVTDLAATLSGDPDDVGAVLLAATAIKRSDAIVLCASRQPNRVQRAAHVIDAPFPTAGMPVVERLIDAASGVIAAS